MTEADIESGVAEAEPFALPGATVAKYDGSITISILHDYKWEWEDVPDAYEAQPGEIVATNIKGRKARRYNNTASDRSWTTFHADALQAIHNDRYVAREALAVVGVTLNKRPDLQIIAQHLSDGVLPHLTDTEAIKGFECEEHPEIAAYLNLTYGLDSP